MLKPKIGQIYKDTVTKKYFVVLCVNDYDVLVVTNDTNDDKPFAIAKYDNVRSISCEVTLTIKEYFKTIQDAMTQN